MIPGWKLRREADRLRQQAQSIAGLLWEPFVQRRYDRVRHNHLKITEATQPARKRIAVYLLYQPGDLLESTVDACRCLDQAGYSVLAVSNTELSPRSRDRLSASCWRLMERPNYGYDFGGYRDGILYIAEMGITPDWLLVLNDSVWFPLYDDSAPLTRFEASGLDLSGTIVHRSFGKSRWRQRKRVIESYFFLFNKRALKSDVFRDFWRKYRLSSNKYNAVHRGERRVAQVMLDAGFSADGLFGRQEFLDLMAEADVQYIRKALMYSAYTNTGFAVTCDALIASFQPTEAWRAAALAHVQAVSNKHGFLGSFPFVSAGRLGVPVLKRSSGALQVLARRKIMAAISAGDLPPFRPALMKELQEAVNREAEFMHPTDIQTLGQTQR